MEDPKERLMTCISTRELEHRWKAAREVMAEHRIDYLIMQSQDEFLGGYVKWFTDLSTRNGYPLTVIFPFDDEMTLISCGPTPPAEPPPPRWAVRGVKRRLAAPYFPSAHYTSTYDAELAARVLKEKKTPTVGLVGKPFIPFTFYEHLRKALRGVNFLDVTDHIDHLMVIKSEEEKELIKQTAKLQDVAMEQIKTFIAPGVRDYEVRAEILRSVVRQGSERQLIIVTSNPRGTPGGLLHPHFENRVIREGDQISVLIEVNGPGGFYTELGRTFTLGMPWQELEDAFGISVEAQKVTLELLREGASPKDLLIQTNDFLQKRGYRPILRLYSHGQGYSLVERPLIREDEPMEIKAGMNITVHPAAGNDRVWTNVCDNYFVGKNGASPCLHNTPKELIVL